MGAGIGVLLATTIPGERLLAAEIAEGLVLLERHDMHVAIPGIADAGIERSEEIIHRIDDDEMAAAIIGPVDQRDDRGAPPRRIAPHPPPGGPAAAGVC